MTIGDSLLLMELTFFFRNSFMGHEGEGTQVECLSSAKKLT